jgi:hypothetical protein
MRGVVMDRLREPWLRDTWLCNEIGRITKAQEMIRCSCDTLEMMQLLVLVVVGAGVMK